MATWLTVTEMDKVCAEIKAEVAKGRNVEKVVEGKLRNVWDEMDRNIIRASFGLERKPYSVEK